MQYIQVLKDVRQNAKVDGHAVDPSDVRVIITEVGVGRLMAFE